MLFKSSFSVWLMLIVSWLARLSAFPIQDSEKEVSFDGSSYITYRLSTTKRTRQDRILLLFRTIKPSGLLLHAGGKKGNFMTLELIGGKLRYFNIVVFMLFHIIFPPYLPRLRSQHLEIFPILERVSKETFPLFYRNS